MNIIVIFVVALIIIGFISWFFTVYNGLIQVKENIKKSWANIDVLLMQRSDEIPKLIKVLKSFVKHFGSSFALGFQFLGSSPARGRIRRPFTTVRLRRFIFLICVRWWKRWQIPWDKSRPSICTVSILTQQP